MPNPRDTLEKWSKYHIFIYDHACGGMSKP